MPLALTRPRRSRCTQRPPGCRGVAPGGSPDRHGDAGRAGDGLAVQVDGEAVLGEAAFHPRRRLAFDAVIDASAVQPSEELTGAVGRIPVDSRLALTRCRSPGL